MTYILKIRQLWLLLAAVLKISELGIAIVVLVRICQKWRNKKPDSWVRFLCAYTSYNSLYCLVFLPIWCRSMECI